MMLRLPVGNCPVKLDLLKVYLEMSGIWFGGQICWLKDQRTHYMYTQRFTTGIQIKGTLQSVPTYKHI